MVRFLDLAHSHAEIAVELEEVFTRSIRDSAFIGGIAVEQFETDFAQYVGAKHCVGVGNGTDAIEIALEALGLSAGDEVIVPANTFIATSEAVSRSGGAVVFADSSPDSMNIDLASVQASLTSRTAGVIAVHLYGNPAELDGLRQLCDRHGLFLIEDCAQAHGGTYRGQHVGNVGDIATFSFYPGKNLGALGDGGAITVNDATLARRAKMIANHGRSSKYDHEFEGRNSRLDSMQAAILSVKLPHLDRWVARRREVAAAYTDLLSESNVLSPPSNPDGEHAYHLYVVRSAARSQLMTSLSERRIETVVHYPIALPDLGAYSSHRQHGEKFYASVAADQVLSLPMGPHLSDEDVAEVAEWVLALSADSIPVA